MSKMLMPVSIALCVGALSIGLLAAVSVTAYVAVFNDFHLDQLALAVIKFAFATLPVSVLGLIGFFVSIMLDWD